MLALNIWSHIKFKFLGLCPIKKRLKWFWINQQAGSPPNPVATPTTPFDNSIEETIKNSNISSKEELKKFNYSFQNSIKRINEKDKQPAYKRLGYNIDQNVENDKKSPLTLDKDKNDEVQLRSNNSFLHDNVD